MKVNWKCFSLISICSEYMLIMNNWYNKVLLCKMQLHYNEVQLYFNASVQHIYFISLHNFLPFAAFVPSCFFFFFSSNYLLLLKSTNDRSDGALQTPCVYTGDILYMFLECVRWKCEDIFGELWQLRSQRCTLFTLKPSRYCFIDTFVVTNLHFYFLIRICTVLLPKPNECTHVHDLLPHILRSHCLIC